MLAFNHLLWYNTGHKKKGYLMKRYRFLVVKKCGEYERYVYTCAISYKEAYDDILLRFDNPYRIILDKIMDD
jgi:hypothetical protein